MNLLVLDGNPADRSPLDAWLDGLEAAVRALGHGARRIALRDRRIAQCKGCFGCWVRTPGACAIRDDMPDVLRAALAADVLALASPVSMGFTSALLRRAQERMLPLLHPYLRLVRGEIRHRLRYESYPALALLVDTDGCDDEDRAIVEDAYREVAKETHGTLLLAASTASAPEEVAHALTRAERLAARAA